LEKESLLSALHKAGFKFTKKAEKEISQKGKGSALFQMSYSNLKELGLGETTAQNLIEWLNNRMSICLICEGVV